MRSQRARCARIDAVARGEIARRRRYGAKMREPGFAALPLEEQNYITRMVTAAKLITIYRTMADPAQTDLSLHPSQRKVLGLMAPDPQMSNWGFPGFVAVMTPEGWLSTWSGLSTRVSMFEDIRKVTQPLLVVNFDADVTILPYVAEGTFANAVSSDKEIVRILADHFAFSPSPPIERGIGETGAAIAGWLKRRFPARD